MFGFLPDHQSVVFAQPFALTQILTSSVVQAKVALQPSGARMAADTAGLNLRQRTRRHNRAFIRQGEWFFRARAGTACG